LRVETVAEATHEIQAALAVAIVAVLLRAPFLVVVAAATATAALIRLL
jgi:hypothetical protein